MKKKMTKVVLKGETKKMTPKRTVTEKPLSKEDSCPFKFTIFNDPGYKQWYLASPNKKSSTDWDIKFGTHLMHTFQKENHMQPSTTLRTKYEEAFVYKCSTLGLSKKQIHILLRKNLVKHIFLIP
jgi:hypothetical protein